MARLFFLLVSVKVTFGKLNIETDLVYEDIICDEKAGCRRHKLTGKKYFGGLYEGSERNEDLWLEVQQYIYDHYDTDCLENVYIAWRWGTVDNSWMSCTGKE